MNSAIKIGDEVTFVLEQGSKNLRAIVLEPSSLEGFHRVAYLHTDEVIKDQKLTFKDTKNRELSLVPVSSLQATGNTVSKDCLKQLWVQVAQHAALGHYRAIHKPQQEKGFSAGDRVPYAGRVFDEDEISNLIDSSLEFWLTAGRYTDLFESEFAKYIGVRKSLLVNSGSSANLIAFMTLTSPQLKDRQIKQGDEVISVAAGFPATIAPAIQYGAVPVFVDVELTTCNIEVSKLEEALSSRTKAVMIAHALGNPFNLKVIKEFCDKHKLWLIEDNCDALGAEFNLEGAWKHTGTVGDIATSSFYPPHHMTMGEGGAVYMKSPMLYKIAASFRDWGRDCWCAAGVDNTCGKRFDWQLGQLPLGYDHKYIYSHFGYNLKATDMQAAIGCAQIKKIDSFVAARRSNWEYLRNGVQDLEEHFILPEATPDSKPSWFGFLLSLRSPADGSRSKIVRYLESKGIQTRMLFAGNFLRHPAFDQIRGDATRYRVVGELKNTDYVMNNAFWFGVYPGLKTSMLDYMIEQLHEAVSLQK